MVKCLSQASKSAYGFERQNVGKRQIESTQRKEPRTRAFYQLDNLLFSAEESSLSKKQRRRSAILETGKNRVLCRLRIACLLLGAAASEATRGHRPPGMRDDGDAPNTVV